MAHNRNEDSLDAIKARDAELHYCRTCSRQVYTIGDDSDSHFFSVDECNRRLAEVNEDRVKQGKGLREPGEDGNLCWTPADHHPFLEGSIPEWRRAERDRRLLLGVYMDPKSYE